MRSLIAFLKKEFSEQLRSGRLTVLGILFVIFGIMNPAVAKLTPWLLETMSESLEESGMTVTAVTVDALTSWTQFFKNIPMMLIAYVLVYANLFTREYEAGTLLLVLTKGVQRYKIVLSKALWLILFWTIGYFYCFGITYGYNAYYWDNSIAKSLMPAIMYWYVFSLLVICLMVLFSVLSNSSSMVMLGTGSVVVVFYLLGLYPKITDYLPTSLMNGTAIVIGAASASNYYGALWITLALCVIALTCSIPLMNKKQL